MIEPETPLERKVALVAGATRGAGRGTAVALGEAGATVLRPSASRRPRCRSPAQALTPGWMRSEMMLDTYGVSEENWREATVGSPHFVAISESPVFVGRAVAALAADPALHDRNGGSFSSGELALEYGFTDLDGSRPDCWRYMVEVQDPGLPPDATGYR